jgi:hypothetical protein
MSKYQAKTDAQTIGKNVLVTVQALGSFRGTASSYLEKCGLKDIKADQWYPMQSYCDFFEMMADKAGVKTLYVIGKSLGQNITLLSGADTVEQVYKGFNEDFKANYRNTHPNEGFIVQETGPSSLQIVFTGPLPSDYIRGVLEGIGHQFSDIEYMTAQIDETQPRIETGGKSTTFTVSWR